MPIRHRLFFLPLFALAISCSKPGGNSTPDGDRNQEKPRTLADAQLIKSNYQPQEVSKRCDAAIQKLDLRINDLIQVPTSNRNADNTLLAFETAVAEFNDETSPLTFMAYVSTDTAIHGEGADCEQKVGQFSVDYMSRRDLYDALKLVQPRNKSERRLLEKTLELFERSGLKLADAELKVFTDLNRQLTQKQSEFSNNLNNDVSTVEFSQSELDGLSADFISQLNKAANGKYLVTTKSTNYSMIMENAKSADVRKAMQLAYLNRASVKNTQLLEDAVQIRSAMAKILGYSTWAEFKTAGQMSKTSTRVLDFVGSLRNKLAARNKADLDVLLKYKKEIDTSATQVNPWDISFLSNQIQKRDYNLDNELIREFFPAATVIQGMFDIYSKMFGVKFKEIQHTVWADGVKLYEVREASNDRLIGLFYADFIPRNGKYGHAAAFPLISGRLLADGGYNVPVSAIVANFTPPTNGKPSLLLHEEVDTVFHEFGHIMHQVLTRAPYARLSGTSVAQDFVEAPSQMLENWVWNPEMLIKLSGHYLDSSKKLPAEILKQMIAAKDFGQGMSYTKQLLYGIFDQTIHSSNGPVDVTKTYDDLYREIVGLEPLQGAHFAATFGHMMGGYDASYYGYLWSKVYAQDMFSIFPEGDLMNSDIGQRYRKMILEQGSMEDEFELLRKFLGRDPSPEAFFKELKI